MRALLPLWITLVFSLACGGLVDETALEVTDRTDLMSIPASRLNNFAIDDDLDQVLTFRTTNLGWQVAVNGETVGAPYDGVGQTFGFAPDGRAWFTFETQEGWSAALGDETFGPYQGINKEGLVFSEDGHSAWLALDEGITSVIHDGTPIASSERPLRLMDLSPDGTRVAWIREEPEGWQLFVNEETDGRHHQRMGPVAFHPDGPIAYVASSESGWHLYWQDVVFGPFQDVSAPMVAPNGELAYGAQADGAWTLRIGDWVSEKQDFLGAGSPTFHGDTFAWWSEKDGEQHVWRGDERIATDRGGGLRFDGDQVIFTDTSGTIERITAALP